MKYVCLALLLAGCGDDNSPFDLGGNVVDLSAPREDLSMSQADMAVETDDPGLAQLTRDNNWGIVYAYSGGGSMPNYLVFADFVAESENGETFTAQVSGPCTFYHASSNVDAGDIVVLDSAQEGTVQVSGGIMPVTIMGDTDLGTDTTSGNGLLWNGGESLTFDGSGGTPGSWSSSQLAPKPVTVTMPQVSGAGSGVSISKSQDLLLTWTGGQFGWVTLIFTSSSTDDYALCTELATAGTLTVPSATLQLFATELDTLNVRVDTERLIPAGGFLIQTRAETDAFDNLGGLFYGTLN